MGEEGCPVGGAGAAREDEAKAPSPAPPAPESPPPQPDFAKSSPTSSPQKQGEPGSPGRGAQAMEYMKELAGVSKLKSSIPVGPEHYMSRLLAGVGTPEDRDAQEASLRADEKRMALSDRLTEAIKEYKNFKRDMMYTKEGIAIIWASARFGEEETFKQIAALYPTCGKLVALRDKKGRTPIHILCKFGWLDILKVVLPIPKFIKFSEDKTVVKQWALSCGIKLHNVRTQKGYTVLHYAVIGGHRHMVEYLLEYFHIMETIVDEFVVQAEGGEDALQLALDFGWMTIYHLLKNARLPFDADVKKKRADIARRIREAKEAKLEAQRLQEEEVLRRAEERRRKREEEEARRLELLRQKAAAEKAEAELERTMALQAQHADWMRAITLKAGARSRKSVTAQLLGAVGTDIATDGSDVNAMLAQDAVCLREARWREENDILPGDPTEWNELLARQKQDMQDMKELRAKEKQREARRLTYPRVGVELSERVRFGRLGEVRWEGLRVVHVHDASPAAKAGLRKDDILTSANGEPLTELIDLQDLIEVNAVRGASKLDAIKFTVRRVGDDGASTILTIVVHPEPVRERSTSSVTNKVRAMGCLWGDIQESKISSWATATHNARGWEAGVAGQPWLPTKAKPVVGLSYPSFETPEPPASATKTPPRSRSRSRSPSTRAQTAEPPSVARGADGWERETPTRTLFRLRPELSVSLTASLNTSVAGASPGPSTLGTPTSLAQSQGDAAGDPVRRPPLGELRGVPSGAGRTPPVSARGPAPKSASGTPRGDVAVDDLPHAPLWTSPIPGAAEFATPPVPPLGAAAQTPEMPTASPIAVEADACPATPQPSAATPSDPAVLRSAHPVPMHMGDSRNWERPWRETPPRPTGPRPLEVVRAGHRTPWLPTRWKPLEINDRDDTFLNTALPDFASTMIDTEAMSHLFRTGVADDSRATAAAATPAASSAAATPRRSPRAGSPRGKAARPASPGRSATAPAAAAAAAAARTAAPMGEA